MAELTIDLTYGTALYEAARDTDKKKTIMEESEQLLEIMKDNPDLRSFLDYPAISAAEKKAALGEIFEGRICSEMLNFLYVLVDKGRTLHLEGILKVYRQLLDKEEGYSYGTVYSVTELRDDQKAKLEEDLSALLRRKIRLTNELDPKLIGGIKILVEGQMIDASVRKKFDDLESQIILS